MSTEPKVLHIKDSEEFVAALRGLLEAADRAGRRYPECGTDCPEDQKYDLRDLPSTVSNNIHPNDSRRSGVYGSLKNAMSVLLEVFDPSQSILGHWSNTGEWDRTPWDKEDPQPKWPYIAYCRQCNKDFWVTDAMLRSERREMEEPATDWEIVNRMIICGRCAGVE